MKGKVIKCVKHRYSVLATNKKLYYCTLKTYDRLKKTEFSNPIAVGDFVNFSIDKNQDQGIIQEVFARKNYVIRQSVNLSFRSQILASNIDVAFFILLLPCTTPAGSNLVNVYASTYSS